MIFPLEEEGSGDPRVPRRNEGEPGEGREGAGGEVTEILVSFAHFCCAEPGGGAQVHQIHRPHFEHSQRQKESALLPAFLSPLPLRGVLN